jgi:AcrR family transcriptional regulator
MADDRLTRREKQERTRADLIEAGARVFARRGFHAATIEEIAEEAGYTHGAVYGNFSGKDELFLAVYEQRVASRVSDVSAFAGDGETPLADRARAAGDQWMERLGADVDGFLLVLEFVGYAARRPEVRERFGEQVATMRHTIGRLLEAEGADLPLGPERTALVIRALGLGIAFEKLLDPSVPDDAYGEALAWLLGR